MIKNLRFMLLILLVLFSFGFPVSGTPLPLPEQVLLPTGESLIALLNRLGLRVTVPEPRKVGSTNTAKVALNLGVAVADGFASIKARDVKKVEQFANHIYEYARILNVRPALMARHTQVKQALAQQDWQQMNRLLGQMRQDVIFEIQYSHQKEVAQLAIVAGWMEGYYLVSKTLEKQFSQMAADELLRFASLQTLEKQLRRLPAKILQGQEVKLLLTSLPTLHTILNRPETYHYTVQDVRRIAVICSAIRTSITQ